jgi:hypothetical protein
LPVTVEPPLDSPVTAEPPLDLPTTSTELLLAGSESRIEGEKRSVEEKWMGNGIRHGRNSREDAGVRKVRPFSYIVLIGVGTHNTSV